MKPWLLHPMAVHFPIALLIVGFGVQLRSLMKGAPAWTASAASWLLWLGAAGAWAALGLGLLAENTAPHVPGAWEVLAEHEELAWWTCGLATASAVFAFWLRRRAEAAPRWGRVVLSALWLAAVALAAATAKHGGELVYDHGMGVVKPDGSAN